ncbi:MAG: nickel pincer cofactor biosynthesis protein LarB [Planctomycetaceae bacterium]|nr:nickel pincer cofactor biosynthesis protein LarB [Planctomycetaceae bacterium]
MHDRGGKHEKTADLGDVRLDLDRRRRCGFPEVVFGESKDVATLKRVIQRLLDDEQPVLITRVSVDKGTELAAAFPAGRYNAVARTFVVGTLRVPSEDYGTRSVPTTCGRVAVVTAGTSDMPVAEEVRETVEWMGVSCDSVVDVGVAGPQRLQEVLPRIVGSDAVVVVAGMEAALASVVGGYVDCPVIAVPTSVGYGASFGGIAALLGMLNSCAANVSVVNIDAGFKAGYIAGLIAKRRVSK